LAEGHAIDDGRRDVSRVGGGIEAGVHRAPVRPVNAPAREPELVELYRHTVTTVHRYLSKLTGGDRALTEDLTQEVYLSALRAMRSRGEALGSGWLMVTARNAFLQRLRSQSRRERREEAVVVVGRAGAPATTDHAGAVSDQDEARRLLAGLSPDQRVAFVLRHADDLPVAEIARLLGRSPRATQSLLQRAEGRVRLLAREARS
jgi:RNA polymerase sigma-70 factor (ECF subfamily)